MDEADKLLVQQIERVAGVKINSLDAIGTEQFLQTVILCLAAIKNIMEPSDSEFIDIEFLKRQKLSVAANRYKASSKSVEYLKTLGYFYDFSFNSFLHPNLKDTRRILGFLFGIMFKDEQAQEEAEKKKKLAMPTNSADEILRRRLQRYSKKPWIMPEFLKDTNRSLLVGGEVIQIDPQIDFERVAGCKSKKTKQMYQHMVGQGGELQTQEMFRQYYAGVNMLGYQIDAQAWGRGQGILVKNDQDNIFSLEDDDEDDKTKKGRRATLMNAAGKGGAENTAQAALANFGDAIEAFKEKSESAVDVGAGNMGGAEQVVVGDVAAEEKTIKDLIEEREVEIKEMEQLQEIQQTDFIEALATDMTVKPAAKKAAPEPKKNDDETKQADEAPAQDNIRSTMQSDLAQKFNLEELATENEAKINELVAQLDQLKTSITTSQSKIGTLNEQKSTFTEQSEELSQSLTSQKKELKKKREVLQEVEKLQGQDLQVLQEEVAQINTDLDQLREEWEEYKKPISDEIFNEKQAITDKRVEYGYKQEKTTQLRKEYKQSLHDAEHKKQVIDYLGQQWEQLPKDQNRGQFLTQVNDMTSRIKMQNTEIKNILKEVRDIQGSTNTVMANLKKVDAEVEEVVFKDAQTNKTAKEIYKEIQTLKSDYDKLITAVQEKTKLQTQIREVKNKIDDFRIKYKNMAEINKLKEELTGIQNENAGYKQMLGMQ